MKNFSNRVAVVTGGASGIGFGLAERFLAEGMKVVLGDIEAAALDKAVGALSENGEVLGVQTDVSDFRSLQSLADATVARFGAVHLLCNNAGVGGHQRFSTTSLETWKWTLNVDLWGVINGCRIFAPILREQDEAHILNTSSMAAIMHPPFLQPYNVAKTAVVALSSGLRQEFQEEGAPIGVSVLYPFFTQTRIADDERNLPASMKGREEADPTLAALREEVRAGLATGQTPAEVAEAVMAGIRADRLHIFPHPQSIALVEEAANRLVTDAKAS
ncbi:short-chain dehydrogenase/reductase SDR [Sphingobium chlorophenolicum L-1]|uniref:Short-chain dehydrogenase/reductase SDR n=1 Tax=Sphingobium chlorophenolicum L-1 TaxID=690566 RepID=F6F365_SPHCR|nr:SDR family NAD(P)-dependent oxidoreductase [Sphingobium chlorophenolicum]AEG50877.1 short-chain dehydrogenase/reductase SDR [Sphingobium chlorophenolicum L-1]